MAFISNLPTDDLDADDCSIDSADVALSEMLGLSMNEMNGIQELSNEGEENVLAALHEGPMKNCSLPGFSVEDIQLIVRDKSLRQIYTDESVCILPGELSLPSSLMRRITDELVYGTSKYPSNRTYESISIQKSGEITMHRKLTRLEDFVNNHDEWKELCHGYLAKCVSSIIGEEMVLYKEKLNFKPPGGSGFAPHLDSPSLRIAFGDSGPRTFVTVMLAIDNMTEQNGCLRVSKKNWSEENHVEVVEPEKDGNPDAGGRAGAIPLEVADKYTFEPIICKGGDIAIFNGWCPHRSSFNLTPFSRRAVFLTYNPTREGDYHDMYYQKMKQMRDDWKNNAMLSDLDHQAEMKALDTIPR